MDHFPNFQGENKKYWKLPPSNFKPQPKQCTFRKSLKIYHRFVSKFDPPPPNMANLRIPGVSVTGQEKTKESRMLAKTNEFDAVFGFR